MRYKILEIYLNFSCNQRCLHCFNSDEFRSANNDLEFKTVAETLFKMRREGYNWLSILGGEPTVYPDIFKVISLAKNLGYKRILTFSNGQKYSDELFVKLMKEAGLTDAVISVFGHKPQIHETVTRVPGSFEKIMKAIDNLKNEKVGIMILLVLNALNYKYFPEIVEFFLDKGIKRYMFFALKYQGRMTYNEAIEKMAVKLSVAFSKIDEVYKIFKKRNLKFPTIVHVPPCILPRYVKYLDNYSTKPANMLCQDKKLSNIKKAHNDLVFKQTCKKCIYYSGYSGFDVGYAKLFGDDEFKPVIFSKSCKKIKR